MSDLYVTCKLQEKVCGISDSSFVEAAAFDDKSTLVTLEQFFKVFQTARDFELPQFQCHLPRFAIPFGFQVSCCVGYTVGCSLPALVVFDVFLTSQNENFHAFGICDCSNVLNVTTTA